MKRAGEVHLCGSLSIRAVELFNDHPNAALLLLKPCCLPDFRTARDEIEWTVGGHTIPATEVTESAKALAVTIQVTIEVHRY